ncbi:(2Fe-2S) ferredoxin domain-containing protein [Sporomusa sp.]|uniref:(2Fe-2S) ferredoxin domain-containing protein n=1 Tax=Sporomusa sp. TaxID=2078658 RepID=UPI002CBBD395|nr:(2Fe-2S) ferredoxin domain-containing protein [Sporomusa sp.]HWR09659.1 (2Fe-2S) ferredoxin domain-containing protein [Sporomusa sp.]
MKTIEDLKRLREQLKTKNTVRHEGGTQIIVGMGTCGIAAGARQVMTAILDEIAKQNLQTVKISQTGCIGMCEKEVLVDVVRPNEPRITYGRVTAADIPKIITEHVVNGRIVAELAIGKFTE